jgi:hypothetical protein
MRARIWPNAAAAGNYLFQAAYTLTFPTDLTGYPGLTAAIGAALQARYSWSRRDAAALASGVDRPPVDLPVGRS